MLLHVMRHGKAQDRAPTGRDADRVLTPEGRDDATRAAAALQAARKGSELPRVITSPFPRALQTAEAVRAVIGCPGDASAPGSAPSPWPRIEVRDELAADRDLPLDLIRELANEGADALLVGHQPTLEDLVTRLIAPAPCSLPHGFKTALIVTLEALSGPPSGPTRWRLAAILDPRTRTP